MGTPDKWKILVVDDEPAILFSIKKYLDQYEVNTFEDPEEALKHLKTKTYDLLVVDYKMPRLTGVDFLIECKKTDVIQYRILLTAFAEKDLLQESINKALVNRVLEKPLDLELLHSTIEEGTAQVARLRKEAEQHNFLEASYAELRRDLDQAQNRIIGVDGGLKETYAKLESVARHPVSVLLTGETGTGKELIAHAIHSLSQRRDEPFIKINCAAIPETLLESELFGYVKGAFTDAKSDRIGKIELANNGTFFLDEISEMKLDLQAKMLRVLQEKEVVRLGSNKAIKVDFRLIAATNRDIKQTIKEGLFREDLFYRINTFPIHLPSLADRREDIRPLVEYFVSRFCQELNIRRPEIDDSVFSRLKEYSWPGNIRELENAVKRVIIILGEQGHITPECFHFLDEDSEKRSYMEALRTIKETIVEKRISLLDVENDILKTILEAFDNNIAKAVEGSGISKNKFYRHKIK